MSKKWTDHKAELSADWVGDGFLLAAKRLREIQDKSPEDFRLVAKILKIDYRKALYLAQIDRTFRDLGVDRNTLTAVGWTKLQVLCGCVTKDNCHQLLEVAVNANVHDLKRISKNELPLPKAHCVLLYFSDTDYALFTKVILAHGATKYARGIVDKESALIKALSKLVGKA
jgi:hypothetical protein